MINPAAERRSALEAGEPALQLHVQRTFVVLASCLSLACLWLLMHPYQGLHLDAQLYAIQALAKLHPALGADLYLQNVSQDRYTIFSGAYAWLIGLIGTQPAALSLYLACTMIFLAAAGLLLKELAGLQAAWLGLAMVIVIGGEYGAAHVFHYAEDFLTARSVAEALVVVAVTCHFSRRPALGIGVAVAAMFVHPIMALPGLLLLACLALPFTVSAVAAFVGLGLISIFAAASVALPSLGHAVVIDTAWLEIVRERAQFLFLTLWTVRDWELNARPFLTLIFVLIVMRDARVRALAKTAILVGASGLAVAFIAGAVGPVALLLQGQAWRWVWITAFVSVLLLAPTLIDVWRDPKCGPICVILLICAWTFEPVDSTLCASLAMFLWLIRPSITPRMSRFLTWTTVAVAAAIGVWIVASSWKILSTPLAETGYQPPALQRIRYIFELDVSAVVVAWAGWNWVRKSTRSWVPTFSAGAMAVCLALVLPSSFRQIARVGSASDVAEFDEWARKIPPTSTVYVSPAKDAGGFVWFTLGRPNYLSPSQSAGVVFSRATALEVKRRSDVLLPVADPDWKILSSLSRTAEQNKSAASPIRRLTKESLQQICRDTVLGFVISPEDVGFERLLHAHRGTYKNWGLYDCERVRAIGSSS